MADLWLVFTKIINHFLEGPIPFNIKRKIEFTNLKLAELGIKTNFRCGDDFLPVVICNINEEDKEIISDIKIFSKFIMEIYFDKDSIFRYDPSAFKGNEGVRLLNNLFEDYYLPYVVRMNKEWNVSLYNLGTSIN